MKSTVLSSIIAATLGAQYVSAVALYGQCGGSGYTGSTTCDSGSTCVYQNDYYSQCLASSSTTTTKSSSTTSKTTTTTTKTTTTTTKTSTTTASTATSSTGAKGTPTGFAAGTTGGAGGVTVTPTTTDELLTYLSDSTTRIIILTKIFDYTSYYGTTAGKACKPWTCSGAWLPQMTIDSGGGQCDSSLTLYDVTYNTAGASKALVVNSNKTIIGKGSSAGIKGIGLSLTNVSNVIIQNIKITDLNPQYVWGGDAIALSGATKVWIDHNYIARIGRQHIVAHYDANTVTISNNYFDGQSTYSAACNGHHYWTFLFLGVQDQITMMQNYIYYTAGRGPHIGGFTGSYNQKLHLVNNYYNSIAGHAVDSAIMSNVLTEGNYFANVTTPDTGVANGGAEYFVQTVSDASGCSSAMGRVCEWNRLDSLSGSVVSRLNTTVLTNVGALSAVKSFDPMDVADVPAYVLANAGVGIVN